MPEPTGTENAAPLTLALVRDLMFVGKITSTAAAAGATVRIVRDPAKLRDAAAAAGSVFGRLIVDLNLAGAIPAAAAWRAATGGEVVGFVSHVDADAIAEARAAGLDRVMARSQFVNVLADLFTSK